MNEQLQLLIDLQKIDSQIRTEENLIGEITEKINHFEEEVQLKERELKEEKEEFITKEKELRLKEMKLEDTNLHLQKCRDKIYQIKSNKELEALDEEIKKTKKEKSLLENETLELMEVVEELHPRIKVKEKNLEEENGKLLKEKKDCEIILDQAKKNLEGFSKERDGIAGKIDKVLLAEYQKFCRAKGDFVITTVKDRVCQGCHRTVSAQLVNEIKKNEQIIRCENCARILYYPEAI